MRKWMIMLLILGLLAVPVLGAEAEAEAVLEGVPQEAQAFLPQEDRGFLNGVLVVVRKALLAVTPSSTASASASAPKTGTASRPRIRSIIIHFRMVSPLQHIPNHI